MNQTQLFQNGVAHLILLGQQNAAGIKERAALKTKRIQFTAAELMSGKVTTQMAADAAKITADLFASVQAGAELSKKIVLLSFYLSAFGVILQVEANLETMAFLATPAMNSKDRLMTILANLDDLPELADPSIDDEFTGDVIDMANIGMPQFNNLVDKIKRIA